MPLISTGQTPNIVGQMLHLYLTEDKQIKLNKLNKLLENGISFKNVLIS